MNDNTKVALIIAGTLILCVCLWIFFSPFQTCVRDGEFTVDWCVRAVSGSIQ